MKTLYNLLFILTISGIVYGQQDAQYTQFMFNKLAFNPGYAGSAGAPCLTALYRNQWIGLEGAPETQVFSFHSPFNHDRSGAGLTIINDEIGPTLATSFTLSYAYRIETKKGVMALGIQGMLRNYRLHWDEARPIHDEDGLILDASNAKVLPNAGFGIYYEAPGWYAGLSVPHLIQGDISLLGNEYGTTIITATEVIHAYFMGGIIVPLNEQVKFKPAFLFKWAENVPLDLDVNASFLIKDRVWFGLSYRMGGSKYNTFGESIDLVAQYHVNNVLKIGMAYDFTLSELRASTSGSFEVMANYCIQGKNTRFTNPRFF